MLLFLESNTFVEAEIFVQCGRTPFSRKYASLKKSWMYLINIYVGIFIVFPI